MNFYGDNCPVCGERILKNWAWVKTREILLVDKNGTYLKVASAIICQKCHGPLRKITNKSLRFWDKYPDNVNWGANPPSGHDVII